MPKPKNKTNTKEKKVAKKSNKKELHEQPVLEAESRNLSAPFKKRRVGHPSAHIPIDKRKVCGAKTNKRGKCDKCSHVPTPDENDFYTPHHGKCPIPKCTGTMRCQVFMLMPNGKCKFHGGNLHCYKGVAHSQFKVGLGHDPGRGYIKYLPKNLAEVYDDVTKEEERLSVQKEIDLLETFIKDLLPRMKGAELWDKADAILGRMEMASIEMDNPNKFKEAVAKMEDAIASMRRIIRSGHNDADLRKELRGIMEDKSRIAAREARRQLEQRMHMSVEEGTALLGAMARVVLDTTGRLPVTLADKLRECPQITLDTVEDKLVDCLKEIHKDIAKGLHSLMTIGSATKRLEQIEAEAESENKDVDHAN